MASKPVVLVSILYYLIIISCTTSNTKSELINNSDLKVNLNHLQSLYESKNIDGVNMALIHIYSEYPDYNWVDADGEGISCIDDVARAGVLFIREYQRTGDQELLFRIDEILNFVLFMQDDNGYFYNFIKPDYTINTTRDNSKATASWWTFRALWFLAELIPLVEDEAKIDRIKMTFEKSLAAIYKDKINEKNLGEANGVSYPEWLLYGASDLNSVLLIALANYYEYYPSDILKKYMYDLIEGILAMQILDKNSEYYGAFVSWHHILHAWGNSQSYALLLASQALDDKNLRDRALLELDNHYVYQLNRGRYNNIVFSKDSEGYKVDKIDVFPQIAYGQRPLVWSYVLAYEITNNKEYLQLAIISAEWFFGNNPSNQQMYNSSNGMVFDGIDSDVKYNKNSGAESTIEGLFVMSELSRILKIK